MRTTLTLDEDVAALLGRLRKARRLGLKEAVNAALRQGLESMMAPGAPRKAFRTTSVSLGRCYSGSLDNVAEALAAGEGERFK